jgi:bacterial/archaeal transporter family-2 protein
MILFFVAIAIVIGGLMPFQAGLNAELTRHLGHPYLTAFISLFLGAFFVACIVLVQGGFGELKKIFDTPPYLFLGGVLGALFVGSSLFLFPKLGATTLIASFVTGQLIGSLIIDHLGLLGAVQHPLSLNRLFGVFLLFTGLFLVIKRGS